MIKTQSLSVLIKLILITIPLEEVNVLELEAIDHNERCLNADVFRLRSRNHKSNISIGICKIRATCNAVSITIKNIYNYFRFRKYIRIDVEYVQISKVLSWYE